MTDRELMQEALYALTYVGDAKEIYSDTIESLRARLAQPEPEPVAWMYVNKDGECEQIEYGVPYNDPSVTPLYTAPPQRDWQGLTDEEIDQAAWPYFIGNILPSVKLIVRQLEDKLKEKNGD